MELTISQQKVLKKMTDFVHHSDDRIFILKGYAGTGKTTLMKYLIDNLKENDRLFKLLSTTGRAAKILSNHTNHEAGTIHGAIYKYKKFNCDLSDIDTQQVSVEDTGQLYLVFEPAVLTNEERSSMVYIVDEASMISDVESNVPTQAKFGSGRLLKELLDYDGHPESKFIFVGDPCQLPPINAINSPALDTNYFESVFNMKAQEGVLTEIMRQDNSIIAAGNYLRKLWEAAPEDPRIYPGKVWGASMKMSQFEDVEIHSNLDEMKEDYLKNIRQNGYNSAVFVCKSNTQCFDTSCEIRSRLGLYGDVQKGDLLMVVQNQMTTGLLNGDMVEVVNVSSQREKTMRNITNAKGFYTDLIFREITVKELFTQKEYTTLILETTLTNKQCNLDSRQQSGLFLDFILRMKNKGITEKESKKQFDMEMQRDPYLNALRCSYGYAITGHKAQGGEWDSVYIQLPRNITLNPIKNNYQWFYTALTRAKSTVHLCKDFFIS